MYRESNPKFSSITRKNPDLSMVERITLQMMEQGPYGLKAPIGTSVLRVTGEEIPLLLIHLVMVAAVLMKLPIHGNTT